eukprot:TRINITY_DN552_c0_g1_i4.p1 TRINITY_DN552_c0_g1~~TRINITY_DN552_c0_g1_i4.p1  ORF type:complete len:267 (+),score=94.82 TRINITY_DN552_c0_g1_i4:338-1138(+)
MLTPLEASKQLEQYLPAEALSRLSDTNLMALALMAIDADASHPWRAYMAVLPRQFSTTLHWPEHALAALQSSATASFTAKKKDAIRRQYEQAVRPLCQLHERFCSADFAYDRFKWALSVLWSRSFSVQIGGESMGALVPFADMFNTAPPASIKLQHRMTPSALELIATAPIAAGEQIFVPYGRDAMSNGQLLMEYGFVLPDAPVKSMMLPAPPSAQPDALAAAKRQLLSALGLARSAASITDGLSCQPLTGLARYVVALSAPNYAG